jgi:hypothetical protein
MMRPYTPAVDDETEAVFADPSGRRHRLARTLGIVVGCLLAAYMVVVAFGLLSGSGAPFTPWPGASSTPQGAPAARGGGAPPGPSPSGHASATPTPSPSTRPRTTQSSTPRPTPVATTRANGRAHGLTKSPNPKKPAG